MFRTLSLSVVSVLLASPAFAHGEDHAGPDHNQIQGVRGELHGSLDSYSVIGVGGRAEFAIVPNGVIPGNVRDEIALSIGGELFVAPIDFGGYYYSEGLYLVPIAAAQWNFYLGERWSIFPELGVAIRVDPGQDGWTDNNGRDHGWIYSQLDAGFGARYHFDDRVALLLRLSTPAGLQVGLTF